MSTKALLHSLAVCAPARRDGSARWAGWLGYAPGLVVVLLGALAAGFLADRFGAPLTLMSLLVGLTLNFLSADKRLTAGLALASGSLLRWGIVLVGVRITFGEMIALGPAAFLAVLSIVGLTMGAGVFAARRLGYDTAFGLLAGGAVVDLLWRLHLCV